MSVKMTEKSQAVRQLFLREHKSKLEDVRKPEGRTLMVLNVPPLVEDNGLIHVFEEFWKINRILFQAKPVEKIPDPETLMSRAKYFPVRDTQSRECYRTAFVVFESKSGLKKVLADDLSEVRILYPPEIEHHLVGGPKKWAHDFKERILMTAEVKELQEEVNQYLAEYDIKQEEEKRRAKEMENVPDEEGWITVSRHGKKPVLPDDHVHDQLLLSKAQKKKNKSGTDLDNFYAFQAQEGKMTKLTELKQKFEEDKKRISQMKAARKFKPY